MLVLGLSGGLDKVDEQYYCPYPTHAHDSAAVLVEDGRVVTAIENERLSRIKHTNKFPVEAIEFCLRERGVTLSEVDRIAYYWGEDYMSWANLDRFLDYERPRKYVNARETFRGIFVDTFGMDVDERLRFVNHHQAHAVSAAAQSGYDEALVCSIDGMGDTGSGLIAAYRNGAIAPLVEVPNKFSLGRFYVRAIGFIGYRMFDEYKVMGLAPYGDPERFRSVMEKSYQLEPDGAFGAWSPWLTDTELHEVARAPGEPFLQIHMDWAAALQVALENIVMHALRHYRSATGLSSLALAGGVAHNCTMNGTLLSCGLFDRVFVQPASHDAGAALGAALQVYHDESGTPISSSAVQSVYWGSDIGGSHGVAPAIARWESLVQSSRETDVVSTAADLLAGGAAIGWVQGRSEFGPRALGNRSILADPRPAENKGRINKMIKKREAYRPFAPTVLEEHVAEYFVVPENGHSLPFMTFVVDVQPDKRDLLGAITHVDGTARVQTVSRDQNPRYWELIRAFGDRTGVPILLNTSFNNNEEPIVDSVDDAIVCFLTTDLDCLVVGDYLVRKKGRLEDGAAGLVLEMPRYVSIAAASMPGSPNGEKRYEVRTTFDERKNREIDENTFNLLECVDGRRTVGELIDMVTGAEEHERGALMASVIDLWSRRLIVLKPAASIAAGSAADSAQEDVSVDARDSEVAVILAE
jgi:carbamoyltransferase